jgi:hypothetical protein
MKKFLLALSLLLVGLFPGIAAAQAALINVPIPPPPGGLICYQGFIYAFSAGPFGTLYQYTLGGSTCGSHDGGFAANIVSDGANSLQYTSARAAMDLSTVDIEGPDRFSQDDSDTIGGTAAYWKGSGSDGETLEGRYQHSWRPFEGQRTIARVNVWGSALNDNSVNKQAVTGTLSGGLEFQATPNWSITPRVSVGAAGGSDFFGGDGALGSLSVASRYRFPQVGRGDLVLGNLLSVTDDTQSHSAAVISRNGLAYQFPIKQQMFGRQMSARLSYVNTYVDGSDIGLNDYHEFAINFGVRNREQTVRSPIDLLRFGVLWTHANDYDSGTFTLGFRF